MNVGGGVPRAPPAAPRPPPRAPPRPRAAPTSAPPHHTPVRSGCPSAIRGTGPGAVGAGAGAAAELDPPCRASALNLPGVNDATAYTHARKTTTAINRPFMIDSCLQPVARLLGSRALLGSEHAVRRAVRQNELPQHAHVLRRILGVEPFDRDLDALLDDARLEPVANHAARCSRFEAPPFDLAGVRVLHVDEEPGVRVLETDLDDRPLNRDRLVHVEGGRK